MRVLALAISMAFLTAGCIIADPASQERPTLEVETDPKNSRIVVKAVDGGLEWADVMLRLHDCGPDGTEGDVVIRAGTWTPYYNQAAADSGLALNDPEHPGSCAPGIDRILDGQPDAKVHVGDFIELCADYDAGAHDLAIKIFHADGERGLGGAFFSNRIQVC